MKVSKMQQRVNNKANGGENTPLGKTWEKLIAGSKESAANVNNIYHDITMTINHMVNNMREVMTNDYATRISNILTAVENDCQRLNSEMERILATHADKRGPVLPGEDEELHFTATMEYSRCIENMQNIVIPLANSVADISLELADLAKEKVNKDKESATDVTVVTDVEFKEEK